ncbi:AAA family ATPase, partial [Rhizobiaceae sp. 2RAB30]
MKFSRLRLLGFKSFVEPSEFVIERGLTGVVGPNGCGKSNLVEALRWVMGESSYKNMRASGMDDVIFSGSATRPARNTAEVTLFLENSDRTAPAAFNDADELQVSRRIEREAGSVYRINGKEARAKDVQLLFADQSTGARSPSMVGQGRIGELIQAKPQARRALLEEAAGISGLHTRRHEAELRLRAAEQNLERLDDVVGELEGQIDSLKRQARQASRFKNLSADIRKSEAILLHLRWTVAKAQEAEAKSALASATVLVGDRAEAQMAAAKEQAIGAHRLPELRDAEAAAAAAFQRLSIARAQIEEEAGRVQARQAELDKRIAQLDADMRREEQMVRDNADILERLAEEEATLEDENAVASDREMTTRAAFEEAAAKLSASEAALAGLTAERAEAAAAARMKPRYWTVFNDEKAGEAVEALQAAGHDGQLLARIQAEGDTFYRGHEGGFPAADIVAVADRIERLGKGRFAGITTFPSQLFDPVTRAIKPTHNTETLRRAADALAAAGRKDVEINAPGTTSSVMIPALAEVGATQCEPGHGLTGTTPLHALEDLPEGPAVVYLSEVSHLHGGRAYCFGGGLYIDPV